MKAANDLKAIWQRLEAERLMLQERIAEAKQTLTQPADHLPEWLDAAEAETEHELQLTLLAQSKHQLEQIEAALQRLNSNQYGYCVVCGQAINPERLSALPYVLTGINCQQREKAHSQA